MNKILFSLTLVLFLGHMAHAEDLVPATTDDVKQFDQQVSTAKADDPAKDAKDPKSEGQSADHRKDAEHRHHGKKDKAPKDNFGAVVSAEAKKLKDESVDQRKEMGKFVSSQRRKNAQNQGKAEHEGSSGDSSQRPPLPDHSGGASSPSGSSGSSHSHR
jgi:hypothetical protein